MDSSPGHPNPIAMPDTADRLEAALADRYAIEGQIGEGGMATVFLAHDLKHNRKVALKVLRPELAAAMGEERFLREIETLASLRHPHILPLHDSGSADGLLYYVMPYVEGESLADRLARETQLPIDDALTIARESAEALAYAHKRGIVHRDVKPDNILLDGGHAVIADFGVARALDAVGADTLTRTSASVGTPQYMSPEQAGGESNVDARTDVYALGAVLYEMLTGEPPYTGPSLHVVLAKSMTDPIPSVRRIRPTVPIAVDAAIQTALARTPADRHQTVEAFAEALTRIHTGDGVPMPGPQQSRFHGPGQALGVYLAASIAVFLTTGALVSALGLPDWVQPLALALLVVGLPIVVATALIQGGAGARRTQPSALRRHFTWRNALGGGVLGFAGLGALTTAYMLMWATGIGPAGNLVAQGAITEGERVILADFADGSGEGYADPITEALRIDLVETAVLDLVDRSEIRPSLELMQLEPGATLTPERAREVAARLGVGAVLEGELTSLGTGYILTATLRETDSGRSLAGFRVTANGADELIPATDRLSRDIRAKSGESLRTIRAGKPLEQATTTSMEALKLYTEGVAAFNEMADIERARMLLEQALLEDSTFAMAWRQLRLSRVGGDRALLAIANAYRYRETLPDLERYVIEGLYFSDFGDRRATIEAYENALLIDPDETRALNNVAYHHVARGERQRARELLLRAVEGPAVSGAAFVSLISVELSLGLTEEARITSETFEERFPGNEWASRYPAALSFAEGDVAGAVDRARVRMDDTNLSPFERAWSGRLLGRALSWSGQLGDGRAVRLESDALARLSNPFYGWQNRVMTAYEEVLLGDTGWAHTYVGGALGGEFHTRPSSDQFHFLIGMTLATAEDPEAAERAILDWQASRPEELRFSTFRAWGERALLQARVVRGESNEVFDTMERLLEDEGCSDACWLFERAMLHDRLGQREQAAAMYERVREEGFRVEGRSNIVEIVHAQLRLGPLYEEMGDTARAVEAYERMVDQWSDGDARSQETVQGFRERIAALGGPTD